MNTRLKNYTNKISNIVKKFPSVSKAIVIGPATGDTFSFSENIMLAIFTEPGSKISKTCIDLNRAFGDSNIYNVDIYMMADDDFYSEVYDLLDDGEVIFEK